MNISNSVYMCYTVPELDTLLNRYDELINNELQFGMHINEDSLRDCKKGTRKMKEIIKVITWKEENNNA